MKSIQSSGILDLSSCTKASRPKCPSLCSETVRCRKDGVCSYRGGDTERRHCETYLIWISPSLTVSLRGWTLGGILGGSKLPGLEVTPVASEPYLSLPASQRTHFDKDISRLFPPSTAGTQQPLETMLVHIPVSSGDGYFRLRITTDNPRKSVAASPVFRVGSLSLASAHPQGASLLGLVPEMLVRSAFVAVKTTGASLVDLCWAFV